MQTIVSVLASPYVQAPTIPLLLLLIKPLTKKLVRGLEKPLTWDDYYLGVDFLYGALTSAIVYAGTLWRRRQAGIFPFPTDSQLLAANAYLFIVFCLLIAVLALHQEFEPRRRGGHTDRSRRIWLGLGANGVGASMLCAFVL